MAELDNMTDHELLMELIEDKRKQDKLRRVKWIIAAVIAAAVLAILVKVVPPVVKAYDQVNSAIETLQDIDLQSTLQSIEGIKEEFNNAMDKVGDLESSFVQLQEFGKKLESIDLDGLSEVISGLGNLVNKFPFLFK